MQQILKNKDISTGYSVVLFTSPSCNPCKQMRQTIEELEAAHSDKVNFYEVNTVENRIMAETYKIKSVPKVVFKNGSEIKDRFAGFIDVVDIESKLMNLLFDFDDEMLGMG
jgi:thioredoxin 1